nr:DEAD/DEAH box helicase [Deinobacterium chartae]
MEAWLDSLERKTRKSPYQLRYVLRVSSQRGRGGLASVQVYRLPMSPDGPQTALAEPFVLPPRLERAPAFVRQDLELLTLLQQTRQGLSDAGDESLFVLGDHPVTLQLLSSLLDSGRLCWQTPDNLLRRGANRLPLGVPGIVMLPLPWLWYVDPAARTLGRITDDAPFEGYKTPPSHEPQPYTPSLHLSGRKLMPLQGPQERRNAVALPVAELRHTYGGLELPTRPRFNRDEAAERNALRALQRAGFSTLAETFEGEYRFTPEQGGLLTLGDEESWLEFLRTGRADLEAQGFTVVTHPDFPLDLAEVGEWYGHADTDGSGWFSLDLGITVDGQRISLVGLLSDLIARQPELFTRQELTALEDDEPLYAVLGDGRRVRLPAGRVRAILNILIELQLPEQPKGPLRLPLLDAARLARLEGQLPAHWEGTDQLFELGRRLRDFGGVAAVAPPPGLNAELRPYQLEGLAWLQFLREYGLSGILADDMGLGKTVQTLAHLLTERASGRADLPSLVIAPTSVISNWAAEAARFAPGLRVLTLHGKGRARDFERIPEHDLIISTYPLLPRDLEALAAHRYHLLILDEAQNIKNSRSSAARAVTHLSARHRLCLTGTPLENHLGELWSQFNFLLPGLLPDERRFRELYRTPIERRGDVLRREALAARVRPFILRREKHHVARELPPKTEIPVHIPLEGDQRDLYEAVRVSLEGQVLTELQSRGLARSRISILSALLKLRQAATDPRLVPLEAARQVRSNAKLGWLQEHLPRMLEEGRRVLIFSSFATLLGHLEGTLDALRVPYSKLTGQTLRRDEQIARFQSGQTQVFLISLKAGGVGLNLTAADTVIHYDPWWNPAAEDQATDRAYRIGQDRPVFVYKLIAAGSVEERILDLQARKAALSRGILEGGLGEASELTAQDLEQLFAPLEE